MNRKLLLLTAALPLIWISCEREEPACDPVDDGGELIFDPTYVEIPIPDQFPPMSIPSDNPTTEEGIALGKKLFFEKRLSGDNTQACASCHEQSFGFTDNELQFSEGIDGILGDRNSMHIINLGWATTLFWDGRSTSLEEQAIEPVLNPIEMHETWSNAMTKIMQDEAYQEMFFYAFGVSNPDSTHAAKALAQFERTMISANSRYDKYLRNELMLNPSELSGRELFFRDRVAIQDPPGSGNIIGYLSGADCFHCHGGALNTDRIFHNNGLDQVHTDSGLAKVTKRYEDIGKFKTPTLRNIEVTGPYMHDGRFETLEEVIDFYSEGLKWSHSIDPLMKNWMDGGVQLTDDEKDDLLAFLLTLTDDEFLNNPDFKE